jgi:hypothetical protein
MKRVLLILSLATCVASPAFAQTVILSCQGPATPPFVITLDMTNNTATVPNSGTSNPFPIQVTDSTISWDENPTFWMRFSLDRVTGLLSGYGTGTYSWAKSTSQCQKSEKKF